MLSAAVHGQNFPGHLGGDQTWLGVCSPSLGYLPLMAHPQPGIVTLTEKNVLSSPRLTCFVRSWIIRGRKYSSVCLERKAAQVRGPCQKNGERHLNTKLNPRTGVPTLCVSVPTPDRQRSLETCHGIIVPPHGGSKLLSQEGHPAHAPHTLRHH